MSEASIKAYEQGISKPPTYALKRIADVCQAPGLYAQHINQDEIMSGLIPPVMAGTKERAAMRFEQNRKRLDKIADEIFAIADGGSPSREYYDLVGNLVSAGLALRLESGRPE